MVEKPQKQNYRNLTSRLVGRASNFKKPKWLIRLAIKLFIKKFNVILDDCQIPQEGFTSFNLFFTRKLKNNTRPIGNGIVSPVDGFILDFGKVNPQNKIYVKHKYYFVEDLILEDVTNLESYCILYLSPSNYHRVHACFDMEIDRISYLPGTLMSVKQKVVDKKDRVYCRNERIVVHGNSEYGKFSFVLIGALLVGKVKLSINSGLETNIKKGEYSTQEYKTPILLKKGEELGFFEMGSSVIILLENNHLEKIPHHKNDSIEMGKSLLT